MQAMPMVWRKGLAAPSGDGEQFGETLKARMDVKDTAGGDGEPFPALYGLPVFKWCAVTSI